MNRTAKETTDRLVALLSSREICDWLWRLSLVNAPPGVRVRVHFPCPFWRLEPFGVWTGFN